MAIIREASGLVAICGIWRNSSRSIEPEPSLGILSVCVGVIQACVGGWMDGYVHGPVEFHESFLESLELAGGDCVR